MPDGSPQVTPLWASYDGEHVLVNAAKGRQKDLNMRARPRVAICMIDPDNTGRYLAIRGPGHGDHQRGRRRARGGPRQALLRQR